MLKTQSRGFLSRYSIIFFLSSLFVILVAGCSSKKEAPSDWSYGKKSVTITYQADKDLNQVDGRQHTLLLVTYQLNDVNSFNRFAGYKEGVEKLLSAEAFDATVMSVDKTFVEPGASGTLEYDRAENAKYVGMVAGYYNLSPQKSVLLREITYGSKRTGMLKLSKTTVINPLTINVVLAKDGIREEKKQ